MNPPRYPAGTRPHPRAHRPPTLFGRLGTQNQPQPHQSRNDRRGALTDRDICHYSTLPVPLLCARWRGQQVPGALQDGAAALVRSRPNGPERRPELRVPNGRHAQRKLHLRVSLSALLYSVRVPPLGAGARRGAESPSGCWGRCGRSLPGVCPLPASERTWLTRLLSAVAARPPPPPSPPASPSPRPPPPRTRPRPAGARGSPTWTASCMSTTTPSPGTAPVRSCARRRSSPRRGGAAATARAGPTPSPPPCPCWSRLPRPGRLSRASKRSTSESATAARSPSMVHPSPPSPLSPPSTSDAPHPSPFCPR